MNTAHTVLLALILAALVAMLISRKSGDITYTLRVELPERRPPAYPWELDNREACDRVEP